MTFYRLIRDRARPIAGVLALAAGALCLWPCLPHADRAAPPLPSRDRGAAQASESSAPPAAAATRAADDRPPNLPTACEEAGRRIAERLGDDCRVVVRPPFVVAGDLTREELNQWHSRTLRPALAAIDRAFVERVPDQPVTVLLFQTARSYDHHAEELFGDRDVSVYGYYKPAERTLVMNISTGGGTLVHELTHALVDFDYPQIPDWFNEGLASLHEQCRFRADGSGIDGLVNWRLPILQKAIREERLRSLRELIAADDFRRRGVSENYAQARYFCMYLQNRGLLEPLYASMRESAERDPLGADAVKALFPDLSWQELDERFRAWAIELRTETP